MKKIKRLFCGLLFAVMIVFFVGTVTGRKTYSDLEKRELKTFAAPRLSDLTNDAYFSGLTTAFSDQLAFRDRLIQGYYLFWFQHYYGDVAEGGNGQLYAAYQTVGKNYYRELAEATALVNETADEVNRAGAEFLFLSIPRKDAVMTADLPDTYISSVEIYQKSVQTVKANLSDNVRLIDAYDLFAAAPEITPYFSTDHHITPRGGYLLYSEILRLTQGAEAPAFDTLYGAEKVIVNGSFNRQIGQKVKSLPEELTVTPKFETTYTRTDNGKISHLPLFGVGNDYEAAFMGGDKAFTVVETDRQEQPSILFVGASFTNVLEAFAVRDYNRMVSVDYRHNTTGASIADYVREYDVDYVVFVPSQSTNAFSVSMIRRHLGKE